MRMTVRFFVTIFSLFLASVIFTGASFTNVQAQSLQGMSCYDLWHARNQVYAASGYCFKTRKAKNIFGRGCFAPYGKLNGGQQRRVDAIRQQEGYMGCRQSGRTVNSPPGSRYASMACNELWRERNSIFARNGHCFKTARGRNAFRRSCFPPYGQLGRADQGEVNKILRWERRSGCR